MLGIIGLLGLRCTLCLIGAFGILCPLGVLGAFEFSARFAAAIFCASVARVASACLVRSTSIAASLACSAACSFSAAICASAAPCAAAASAAAFASATARTRAASCSARSVSARCAACRTCESITTASTGIGCSLGSEWLMEISVAASSAAANNPCRATEVRLATSVRAEIPAFSAPAGGSIVGARCRHMRTGSVRNPTLRGARLLQQHHGPHHGAIGYGWCRP